MAVIDPLRELRGAGLRRVIIECLENGRVLVPEPDGSRSHAEDRMEERHVTAPEIESALRSGSLATTNLVAGKWRYSARRQQVEVIFTFDVDDEGNLLVVVTVMRKDR